MCARRGHALVHGDVEGGARFALRVGCTTEEGENGISNEMAGTRGRHSDGRATNSKLTLHCCDLVRFVGQDASAGGGVRHGRIQRIDVEALNWP